MQKIWNVSFSRAQRGWICEIVFTVTTARQFTEETHAVKEGSAWLIGSFWRARRAAKAFAKSIAAKPGERERLGWAA